MNDFHREIWTPFRKIISDYRRTVKRMFVRKCLQSFGCFVMIGAGQRKNRDKKPNRKAEKAKKRKKQIRKSWKFWRDNRYDCICQRDIGE